MVLLYIPHRQIPKAPFLRPEAIPPVPPVFPWRLAAHLRPGPELLPEAAGPVRLGSGLAQIGSRGWGGVWGAAQRAGSGGKPPAWSTTASPMGCPVRSFKISVIRLRRSGVSKRSFRLSESTTKVSTWLAKRAHLGHFGVYQNARFRRCFSPCITVCHSSSPCATPSRDRGVTGGGQCWR